MKGSRSLKAVEWLCTAPMDKPNNSCTYTLTLNDKAGIENDFTVTRLAEDEFFIVTGASATKYVMNLLQKWKVFQAHDKEEDMDDLLIRLVLISLYKIYNVIGIFCILIYIYRKQHHLKSIGS